MASLSAKEEAFVAMMADSSELAQRGFDMLLKRANCERFFDAFREKGFFNPERNPVPEPAEEGYFRIPYWNVLDYLVAVSRHADEQKDDTLASKVMEIVRSVTQYTDQGQGRRDNYHTARKCAEVLGLLPLHVVTEWDLDQLLPAWLDSRFDRGRMVGHALDEGIVARALASGSATDWAKAVVILRHCTAVHWEKDASVGERLMPRMAVEDYSLQELMRHHVTGFGRRAGTQAAAVLLARVREVYSAEYDRDRSCVFRPAVEEHEQNHDWRSADNVSVSGLRDVLLHWCDVDADAAKIFIAPMLTDSAEIVRRIGLYLLDSRWQVLQALFGPIMSPQLFAWGHLHELYNLLQNHFAQFSPSEQETTVAGIRLIPATGSTEDDVRSLKREQRHWLSAVAGKGCAPADSWFQQLEADLGLGRLPAHPDFDVYLESWSGSGPSPYQLQELLAFGRDGSLVSTLNAFEPTDLWRGPTVRSLVDTLGQAVKENPELFVDLLPTFLSAKRAYQYGVLNGLKEVWQAAREKPVAIDWGRAWERLLSFIEQVVVPEAFWAEDAEPPRDITPTRDWIPPLVADLLQEGTRRDEHAYPPELLPRGWNLLRVLLERSAAVESPSEDDPMTQAINSPKGKAVEGLFLHALRVCRLATTAAAPHAKAWETKRPVFDDEVMKCSRGNYEFSTLCGAYLANLDYLSSDWLVANMKAIFPEALPANYLCALGGLAYGPATRRIYVLLRDSGVIDWALRAELKGRHTREKLIQRIAVAYLWGEEALDSKRWSYLFDHNREQDLIDATRFLWGAQGDQLSEQQRGQILEFWKRSVAWAGSQSAPPTKLLAALATLSCYVKSADGPERDLLAAVAPYVHHEHATHEFIKQLQRLVDVSPVGVSDVLGPLLKGHVPMYDYDNRLKALLTTLADKGQKEREDVLRYAEMARSVPGMEELFKTL